LNFTSILYTPLHIKKKIGLIPLPSGKLGLDYEAFNLGGMEGELTGSPFFLLYLEGEKYVLHMLVFCYFHVTLASLQHGVHGGRKGWVLRKLL
jgi:hypothetical protein